MFTVYYVAAFKGDSAGYSDTEPVVAIPTEEMVLDGFIDRPIVTGQANQTIAKGLIIP